MALPEKYALPVYRGDSVGLALTLWRDAEHTVPVDLSGAVVTAQVRLKPDESAVITSFEVSANGQDIILTLSPDQSALLPPSSVFDVQVDWSGGQNISVQTVVAGAITTTADVTRVTT